MGLSVRDREYIAKIAADYGAMAAELGMPGAYGMPATVEGALLDIVDRAEEDAVADVLTVLTDPQNPLPFR